MELNKLFEEVLRESELKNRSEDVLREAKLFEEVLGYYVSPALILNEDEKPEDRVAMNNRAVHKELADKYLEPKLTDSPF